MNDITLIIIATLAIVSLIDFIPKLFSYKSRAIPYRIGYNPTPDYLIMPTVYGNISYLQNIRYLKKYADKVVICTSAHESAQFYRDLEKVCTEYGFRYMKARVTKRRGKPVINAYSIYKNILKQLHKSKEYPDNLPCLLMDADTYANINTNNIMRSFISSDADVCSLRCEAHNPRNIIEKLQAFEYRVAMNNRRMDPWMTSGAASLGKLGVLNRVFSYHSDFFPGGDVEIGKLARIMGHKVRHLDATFYTVVPDTLKDWYSQRVIWFAGGIRHHLANIDKFGWFHFFVFIYNSLIIYLLFPLRWIELINFPLVIPVLVAFSLLYVFILEARRNWSWELLFLPLYSFIQSMLILPVALRKYAQLSYKLKSFGRLHYQLPPTTAARKLSYSTLNITSTAAVISVAIAFTIMRLSYWASV